MLRNLYFLSILFLKKYSNKTRPFVLVLLNMKECFSCVLLFYFDCWSPMFRTRFSTSTHTPIWHTHTNFVSKCLQNLNLKFKKCSVEKDQYFFTITKRWTKHTHLLSEQGQNIGYLNIGLFYIDKIITNIIIIIIMVILKHLSIKFVSWSRVFVVVI